MTACAMMEFPAAAKPFERPFSECWQEINKAVRQATVLSECASCAKKRLCRPCTAMLVAETGDANKKAPYGVLFCWGNEAHRAGNRKMKQGYAL